MINKYRIRVVQYQNKPEDYILERLISAKYETYETIDTFKSEDSAKAYYEQIKEIGQHILDLE